MDWRLLEYAKEAEDTASGLQTFKTEIPQYSGEITGDIAELFAISSALHGLHNDLDLSRFGRHSGRILRDLEICLPSLGYTLDNVLNMFNKSNRRQAPGAFPGTPPYAQIWEDSLADMKAQGIALPKRLEMYRTYLQGMQDMLKSNREDEDVEVVRVRLSRLLKRQEPVEDYFTRLGVSHVPARTPQPYPPSVPRPNVERFQTYPNPYSHLPPPPAHPFAPPPHNVAYGHTPPPPGRAYPPPPPPPPFAHHPPPPPPPPPPLPPRSPMPYGNIPYIPPVVPEPPQSPTFSNASSQSYSTQSNDSGGPVAHWAMKIFDGRHSSTPFKTLGQPTKCLGRDEPEAIELLDKDDFEKVIEMPFEATNVWVRLYWRAEDKRARILFLTLDPSGRRMRYCFPLTGLKMLRTESCLQLCRINRHDGQLDLWANLRFTLYERMVLFYCTLVALKFQDVIKAPAGLEDYFQPGEKEEFGGQIQDGSYLHALRIFRDKDSGGVRFEATPRRGTNTTIPIWTAFVTQYIGRRSWMKRVGNSTIQFRELHPYIFCDGYRVPRGNSGRYQLTFSTSQDARSFMEIFHSIRVR